MNTPTPIPAVKSMLDLEQEYRMHAQMDTSNGLDLGKVLPALGSQVRPLVPGELMAIIADTGVGKSAFAQTIAMHARPNVVLNFSMELPGTLMFERQMAMKHKVEQSAIEATYKTNESYDMHGLHHIYTCEATRLSTDDMKEIIDESGVYPNILIVDYIGLMSAKGTRGRYERMSDAAEELKSLAKRTKTVVIVVCQVSRKEGNEPEIYLHDAKDSGSIENSAGLLLGLWRDTASRTLMHCKILKNTKGTAGSIIDCEYDGARMQIRPAPVTFSSPANDVDMAVDYDGLGIS